MCHFCTEQILNDSDGVPGSLFEAPFLNKQNLEISQFYILGMKKFFLTVSVVLSAAVSLSAQSYSWNEGWTVGASGGYSIYAGEHNRQLNLKFVSAFSADLFVGKWFNPFIGTRLTFTDFEERGATKESYIKQDANGAPVHIGLDHLKKNYSSGAQWLFLQQFNAMNLHADFMVNVSNLFGSDDKIDSHIWNAVPYVGLGFPYVLSNYGKSSGISFSVVAGLFNSFPVYKNLSVTADLCAALLDDSFDGETGGLPLEGYANVKLGISYSF